jgi:hypothetical protein
VKDAPLAGQRPMKDAPLAKQRPLLLFLFNFCGKGLGELGLEGFLVV